MKQKLLSTIVISAVALTTSLSANAANVYKDDNSKLDVIGRVKVNINNNDADSVHRQSGTARLGLDGKTKVNDAFGVFGYIIYDLAAQETENVADRLKIREAWVGFDFNEFGKVSFGRYTDAFYLVTKVTDLFVDWGKYNGVTYWGLTKNDFGGRKDGQVKYQVKYNGLQFAASYQFKQSNKYINYGTGFSAGYIGEIGDKSIGILAGYNHYDGLTNQPDSGYHENGLFYGADKNEAAVSVFYGDFGAPGLYAAAVYNYGKLDRTYKSNGVEAALSYTTPGTDWTFTANYQYAHNGDEKLSRSDLSVLKSAWTGEILYRVTPKFNIYTDFEHRYKSVLKKEKEDLATIGLIYNF